MKIQGDMLHTQPADTLGHLALWRDGKAFLRVNNGWLWDNPARGPTMSALPLVLTVAEAAQVIRDTKLPASTFFFETI